MPLKRASGDVSKEDTVSVEAELLRLLCKEVAEVKQQPAPAGPCFRCVLCPFRTVRKLSYYNLHLDRHCDQKSYVLSMKQLALIKSLYDSDTVKGQRDGRHWVGPFVNFLVR